MSWLFVFESSLAAYFLWSVISLLRNYIAVRKVGLPIFVIPINPENPIWILLYRNLPVLPLLMSLPLDMGKFARCSYMGWQFQDKQALHRELGDAFILVTPGMNDLYVANPETAYSILGRRKDFIKPTVLYG